MKSFLLRALTSWATLTFFSGAALYWMKQLFISDSNFFANGRSPSFKIFSDTLLVQNCLFDTKAVAKNYFWVSVTFGTIKFFYERWTRSFHLVDSMVKEIVIWTLYYVTRKYSDYMQYYMMPLEQFDRILAKDLSTVIWWDKVQILACLVMWLGYYSVFT